MSQEKILQIITYKEYILTLFFSCVNIEKREKYRAERRYTKIVTLSGRCGILPERTTYASPPRTLPRHDALRSASVGMRCVNPSAHVLSVPQCCMSTILESTDSLSNATSNMRRMFVTGFVECTLLTVPMPSFRTRVHVVCVRLDGVGRHWRGD